MDIAVIITIVIFSLIFIFFTFPYICKELTSGFIEEITEVIIEEIKETANDWKELFCKVSGFKRKKKKEPQPIAETENSAVFNTGFCAELDIDSADIRPLIKAIESTDEKAKVLYICDRKKCFDGECLNDLCEHTTDIKNAKNFKYDSAANVYIESEGDELRAEVVKEFADLLREFKAYVGNSHSVFITDEDIDNLVEEMTEGKE